MTLDERKTLTKVSTRKPLTTIPLNKRTLWTRRRKQANSSLREEAVCIVGGESKALGFHQETTEESRK